MIDVFPFSRFTVAVLGLDGTGRLAARALMRSGAEVWAWDDSEGARAAARAEDIPLVDLYLCNWKEPVSLVVAPSVPHGGSNPHKVVALARAAGAEVIGAVELLARAQRDAAYIGVTGTYGKATTTALIGHVLGLSGRDVEVGGLPGRPVLGLQPLETGGVYVLDMPAAEIDLTVSVTFDAAVLLNVDPDDTGADATGMRLIFHRQTYPRAAVVGVDDAGARTIFDGLRRVGEQRVFPVSAEGEVEGGVYVSGEVLVDAIDGRPVPVLGLAEVPTLAGRHNWQNAAAAYAVARAVGVAPHAAMASLRSFPGLTNRQERVATVDGILYVNDSRADRVEHAARALSCHDMVYWIAGGRSLAGDAGRLGPHLKRVRHAVLFGAAGEALAATLDGRTAVTLSDGPLEALAVARERALAEGADGATVMLSPAAPTHDGFDGIEALGDAFRAAVEALPGDRGDDPISP